MEEDTLLAALRAGSADALRLAISRCGAYVYTVVRNRACGQLAQEDLEEIASDVFIELWQHPERVRPGCLQSWLGVLARNKTIDRLRRRSPQIPLDEDLVDPGGALWQTMAAQERAVLVRQALDSLSQLDREIFLRYYDLCESTAAIAEQTGLSRPAVKTRLHRGRQQLKAFLSERGLNDEDELERLGCAGQS